MRGFFFLIGWGLNQSFIKLSIAESITKVTKTIDGTVYQFYQILNYNLQVSELVNYYPNIFASWIIPQCTYGLEKINLSYTYQDRFFLEKWNK